MTQDEWNSLPDATFDRFLAEATVLLEARKCPLCERALDGDICPDCYDGAPDAGVLGSIKWTRGYDLSEDLHLAAEYRVEAAHERGEL